MGKISSGAKNLNEWKKVRSNAISKADKRCRFCGGLYQKYMICFHLDENPKNNNQDNVDMACKLCYIITHINLGYGKDIKILMSKMSQVDIVKETVNYISKFSKVPHPMDIDNKVKTCPISFNELCNLVLCNKGVMPNELKRIKIFFTPKIDIEFVSSFGNQYDEFMFADSDYDSDSDSDLDSNNLVTTKDSKIKKLKIKKGKFTEGEIEIIKKILNFDNNVGPMSNMKEKMKYMEEVNKRIIKKVQNGHSTIQSILSNHNSQVQRR
jgi:hypothetical protein